MNRPGLLLTALLLATVAALFSFNHRPVSAQGNPENRGVRWEYRLLSIRGDEREPVEQNLNQLGDERWEFAGTFGSVRGGGGAALTSQQFLVLKRPKR